MFLSACPFKRVVGKWETQKCGYHGDHDEQLAGLTLLFVFICFFLSFRVYPSKRPHCVSLDYCRCKARTYSWALWMKDYAFGTFRQQLHWYSSQSLWKYFSILQNSSYRKYSSHHHSFTSEFSTQSLAGTDGDCRQHPLLPEPHLCYVCWMWFSIVLVKNAWTSPRNMQSWGQHGTLTFLCTTVYWPCRHRIKFYIYMKSILM